MATCVSIACKECGKTFELFWEHSPRTPFICPYCGKSMGDEMSNRVLSTLGGVVELNVDFAKYHSEYNEPQFEVSFKHFGQSKK